MNRTNKQLWLAFGVGVLVVFGVARCFSGNVPGQVPLPTVLGTEEAVETPWPDPDPPSTALPRPTMTPTPEMSKPEPYPPPMTEVPYLPPPTKEVEGPEERLGPTHPASSRKGVCPQAREATSSRCPT